jgi:hypothetical protein
MSFKKYFILYLAALVSFVFYINRNLGERSDKLYKEYYIAKINGKLIYVRAASGAVFFKTKGSSNEFAFIPECDKGEEARLFQYTAKPGDSVSKDENSYTLQLYKGNIIYRYSHQLPYHEGVHK